MRSPRRRFGGQRRSVGRSQRKYTWVTSAIPPTLLTPGLALPYELLSPVRPPSDITTEVYQSMTNPTIIRVRGHVTIVAERDNDCITQAAVNACYAWGIYKDTDAVSTATFTRPFLEGNSNDWMHHESGFIVLGSQVFCAPALPSINDFGSLTYRRYEFDLRRYKRRLDSQRDTLVFAIENAGPPFGNGELAFSAYFRMLLLE